MHEASDPSGADDQSDRADATLATLVPRPSVARNLLAVAAAVAVLVGAGMAPDYVTPQVTYGGGSAEVLRVSRSVLTATDVIVTSKGDVELVDVGRAPGAELLGAWVLSPAEIDRFYASPDIDGRDPLHTLDLRYQGAAPLDRLRLPQRVEAGRSAYLVLLWTITDCSALRPGHVPDLTLRSPVGITTDVPLTDVAGATFSMEALTSTGVCDPTVTAGDPWGVPASDEPVTRAATLIWCPRAVLPLVSAPAHGSSRAPASSSTSRQHRR